MLLRRKAMANLDGILESSRCEEPTHWKRPWCWGKLRARGEGGNRGWDSWVASLTQHEFEQTPGDSKGQGNLACYSPWSHKETWQSDNHLCKIKTIITNTISKDIFILKDKYQHIRVDALREKWLEWGVELKAAK